MFRRRLKDGVKRLGRKVTGRGTPEPAVKPAAPRAAAPAPAPPKPAAAKPVAPAPPPTAKPPAAKPTPPAPVAAATPAAPAPKKPSFAQLAALAAQGELDEARHADQSGTDLDAYRERMRANGRDVELAGVGLNTADDGVQFIGPVDNESSRAKAAGEVLSIDQDECISCGTCVEQTADVFFLEEDDKSGDEVKAEVLKQEGPMDLIQDAIDACPVTCIHWLDRDELDERHSAGGLSD